MKQLFVDKLTFPLRQQMCNGHISKQKLGLVSNNQREELRDCDFSKDSIHIYKNLFFGWGCEEKFAKDYWQVLSCFSSLTVIAVAVSVSEIIAEVIDKIPSIPSKGRNDDHKCHSSQNRSNNVEAASSWAIMTSTLQITNYLPISGLDGVDKSHQSKTEGVAVEEAAERVDYVVLWRVSDDVHCGVLNHSGSSRLSRITFIPTLLQRNTFRIHDGLMNCTRWVQDAGKSTQAVWSSKKICLSLGTGGFSTGWRQMWKEKQTPQFLIKPIADPGC